MLLACFACGLSHKQDVVEQLPSSLYDIAAAMIDRLDPTAALVMKVASVVGDVFTAETLLQLNVLHDEV